jgi:hypothetical protein
MSNVIKKCPKDGIVYDASFAGNCASCFGPLKYFCKTHNEWLESVDCPKCAGASTPDKPAAAAPPSSGPSIVGILAVLAICVGVFVACGWFLYRAVYTKPKPVNPPVARPVVPTVAKPVTPPTPAPPPPMRAAAAVSLSVSQLLADPDQYLGRQVKVTGTVQFRDAGRETFDLRDGDHLVTVQYAGVTAAMKTTIAGIGSGQRVMVTGVLRRDDADNSYYVVAGSAAAP